MNKLSFINGPIYIDSEYGAGLVPGIISSFLGKQEQFDFKKLESNITNSAVVGSSMSESKSSQVVVLDFKQPVVKYNTYQLLGTQTYINILSRLKVDESVCAVVLDVDSGGGQAYGTPEFYDAILDFKKSKPIVVYTGGYLCSAGYYFAAAANKIIANPRADKIGSIGAYATIIDFNGIYEKYGARVFEVYSSLSDEKNKTHRDLLNGTDADFSQYVKNELDPMVETFHKDMTSARVSLSKECLRGGTWNGVDALALNLVDANGTLNDAISMAYELSVEYNENKNKTDKSSIKKNKTMAKLNLPNLEKSLGLSESLNSSKKALSGKTGAFLETTTLESLNTSLGEKDALIASLTAEKQSLTASNEQLTTDLSSANERIVELGAMPGTSPTTITSKGDKFDDDSTDSLQSSSIYKSLFS